MQKTNHTVEIYYKCHSGTDNNNKLSVVYYTDDECAQRIITIRKVHTDMHKILTITHRTS